MVNNKQTTDELNMSTFLSRCNHSVNALIVTLITQTRSLFLFCSFQTARFQISSYVQWPGQQFFKMIQKILWGWVVMERNSTRIFFLAKSN